MTHNTAVLDTRSIRLANVQRATSNPPSLARPPTIKAAVLNVALLSDSEIIVHGLAAMLSPYSSRIRLTTSSMTHRELSTADLTLIDTFPDTQEGIAAVDDALADPRAGAVAILMWGTHPNMAQEAIERGCRGCIDKALGGEEIVAALQRIGRGGIEVSPSLLGKTEVIEAAADTEPWPGHCYGLSRRESQIVTLIVEGLTNIEIAEYLYISINTVKAYVRTAYRKIGAESRSQAVRWGMEHGFQNW